MDDYEREYRRLRRDGLVGWGASHPAKDIARWRSINAWWDHVTRICRPSPR
ncbi:hypothetical protein [Ensifer sp. 4252]|uniref:hypothetical protein n=1 Tax=Ensifer sp. 4252 TaxID=3373915 RepID=UPI003D23A1F5